MDFKKIFLLLIIGLITISAVNAGLFGSGTQEVTVDGVNFVLDDTFKITGQEDTFINFVVKDGVTGYLTSIVNDEDLEGYIQNDTEFGYTVFEVTSPNDVKEYGFIDEGIDKGYFIVFEKNDHRFVYQISASLSADDNDVKEIVEAMAKFASDNNDLKPI